jgi:hypothetical protein
MDLKELSSAFFPFFPHQQEEILRQALIRYTFIKKKRIFSSERLKKRRKEDEQIN